MSWGSSWRGHALRSKHIGALTAVVALTGLAALVGVAGCASGSRSPASVPASAGDPPAVTPAATPAAIVPRREVRQPAASAPLKIGVVANVAGFGEPRQRLVLQLGMKLIREDRGNYAVAWAHAHGINCIGVIYLNPGSPGIGCDEIELDNEPYWENVDPGVWARQALAVAKTLRAHGIAKPILLPLLAISSDAGSSFDAEGNYTYQGITKPWVDWVNEAAPDLWRYVDGFAIHPYTGSAPPTYRAMNIVRSELDAIPAARGKPFWITEIGWGSGPSWDRDATTETNQAVYLRLFIDAMKQRKDVAAVVVYDLVDGTPAPYQSILNAYGLLRNDSSPKPSLAVVKDAIAALR